MLAENTRPSERYVRWDPAHSPGSLAESSGNTLAKRTLDLILGVLLLVFTAPLMILAAALVKLTSRGPVLYTQTRLGQDGKLFTIYKIRTMQDNCEQHSGPCWSTPGDPRILPVGRFLRWSHLDELPQLWNVLRGDMSLVGPRPERPELTPPLERAVAHYRQRLAIRPGVTGLAQVQLPADTDLASVRRKLACDLYYVQRYGLLLDLRIILATVCNLVGIPGAWSLKVLGLPGGEAVERAYESLPAEPVALPHVQTV